MACRKLEAMAIYVVKLACGNDILSSVCISCRIPGGYAGNSTLVDTRCTFNFNFNSGRISKDFLIQYHYDFWGT